MMGIWGRGADGQDLQLDCILTGGYGHYDMALCNQICNNEEITSTGVVFNT